MAEQTEGQPHLALWLVVWHGADGYTLPEKLIFALSFVLSCRRLEDRTHTQTPK